MFFASQTSCCTTPPKAFQAVRDFADRYKVADAGRKDKLSDELCEKIRANEARKEARGQAAKYEGYTYPKMYSPRILRVNTSSVLSHL